MSTSRYCCMIWHEAAVERELEPGRFDVVKSQETLFIGNKSLGGLFQAIRENKHVLLPDAEADS